MRTISIQDGKPLRVDGSAKVRLREWLLVEHQKAIDARYGLENVWRTAERMYQGTPPDHQRWIPFENAPVIEVTVGAMACDQIYAQAIDLIFQVNPPVTVRSRKREFDASADAIQDLVTHGTMSKYWNFTPAIKEGLIDDVKLGTAIWYIPYTKTIRKTNLREIVTFGPKIYSIAPEDFLIPASAVTKDIEATRFATLRLRMNKAELKLRARLNNWTIDDAAAPDQSSMVQSDRQRTAGLAGGGLGGESKPTIIIGNTFCLFDIDDDGIDEDLEVVWNMTSGNPLKVMYNRYAPTRPFVLECYQDRAHVPWGLGVMEMMIPFEREITEIHNNHIWNLMIANTKLYQGPSTCMQEMTEIFPGKFIVNDDGEIKALDMGQINGTMLQGESAVIGMARERAGVQGLSGAPRIPGRTPGISTLSMLQQANRRFTPAFDNMRCGVGNVVLQCLLRLQEQVRGGNEAIVKKLADILGEQKAELVIELFKHSAVELTDALDIQLTASSVSVNREADRQNMTMLVSQIYQPYLQGMAQLAQVKAQPPFPGADKVADQAAQALNRLMHKIVKTFDQISDVNGFLIDLDEIRPAFEQLGMGQIPQQMQGAMNGGPPVAGAPPPAPPAPGGAPL